MGDSLHRLQYGRFDRLVQSCRWDGITDEFRFLQLSPTLLLFAGHSIPAHFHPGRPIDETWLLLPQSAPLEVEFTAQGKEQELWERRLLDTGSFCVIPGGWNRKANCILPGGEFQFLSILADADDRSVEPARRIVYG